MNNRADLAHLSGADFTNAFHTDNGGVAVTIRFGVTLRWDSLREFADWLAVIDDLVWGLQV